MKLPRRTSPLNYVRRRWRSVGFGIHSPFAYSLAREVLRPHDTGGLTLAERVDRWLASPQAGPAQGLTARVFSNLRDAAEREAYAAALEAMPRGCGMHFCDGRRAVVCPFPHLPRQRFVLQILP